MMEQGGSLSQVEARQSMDIRNRWGLLVLLRAASQYSCRPYVRPGHVPQCMPLLLLLCGCWIFGRCMIWRQWHLPAMLGPCGAVVPCCLPWLDVQCHGVAPSMHACPACQEFWLCCSLTLYSVLAMVHADLAA